MLLSIFLILQVSRLDHRGDPRLTQVSTAK